jgi:hypothetical protein
MKHHALFILCTVFIYTGCSSPAGNKNTNAGSEVTEAALPKGKYVLEDDDAPGTAVTAAVKSLNGYNNSTSSKNTTPAEKPYSNLKRRFKNLLVFHADDTMKINKSYLATLILGKDQVFGDLKTEVLDNSGASNDEIKQDTTLDIGTKMRARLIDMSGATNKGFTIELIGGEDAATQSMTEKRKKVTWQWKLTPQAAGLQELKLSINIIEKDGETVNLPVRNIPVMIFAEKEDFLTMTGNFFKNDSTKWILSAILIPVFIAWFTTKMRNRHHENSSKQKTPATNNVQHHNENTAAHPPNTPPQKPNNV